MSETEKAAAHWDQIDAWHQAQPSRIRWWESDYIQKQINKRICGKPLSGTGAGLMELVQRYTKGKPVKRAVSVGCGPGVHEAIFVQAGLVEHFDLFDISPEQVEAGRQNAAQLGLSDQMNFKIADAFSEAGSDYDLVFWCGSLHHMSDVDAAIRWSRDVLRNGGLFLMNEYVAANRFQWSGKALAAVNIGRMVLPERVFENPNDPRNPYRRFINRPTLAEMEYDPSEAMDSARINSTLKKYFPKANIRNVGGNFYHLGLSDILTNIPEESTLLRWSMIYDRLISFVDYFSVAIAQKQ